MFQGKRKALIFLGAAFFSALSVALLFLSPENPLLRGLSYAVDTLAAVFLGLVIWQIIRFFQQTAVRQRIFEIAHRTELSGRLYDDYTFRTMLTSYGSLAINIFFALTKAAAGWYFSSVWLIALAFYYLILCLAKALVLRKGRRKIPGESTAARLVREWRIYRLCGILLFFMTTTLQGIIILIVEQGNAFTYRGTLVFAVALYDFYSLISSIVFMTRTRRKHSPLVVSLKAISFATSLVAMLTLQTAMFASFSDGLNTDWQKFMNIMTGTVVCVILMLWGAFMIRRSHRELKKLQEELL